MRCTYGCFTDSQCEVAAKGAGVKWNLCEAHVRASDVMCVGWYVNHGRKWGATRGQLLAQLDDPSLAARAFT